MLLCIRSEKPLAKSWKSNQFKNCSYYSLLEWNVLLISNILQILAFQPRISKVFFSFNSQIAKLNISQNDYYYYKIEIYLTKKIIIALHKLHFIIVYKRCVLFRRCLAWGFHEQAKEGEKKKGIWEIKPGAVNAKTTY